MSNQPQNNISWYANVYYSYRDYPIKHLNTKYKKSELKTIYNTLIRKMFGNFQISIANDQESELNGGQNSTFNQKKPFNDIMNSMKQAQNHSQRNSSKSVSIDKGSEVSSQVSIVQVQQQPHAKNNQNRQNLLQSPQLQTNPVSQSFISSLLNIQKSKQNINLIRNNTSSKPSSRCLNALQHMMDISNQSQDKNMDVLYELMIGMIRLTMKRITVEIEQEIKIAKQSEKKFEIIDEEMERSEQDTESDQESSFKTISQPSEPSVNSSNHIKSKSEIDQENNYKFVISYAANLGQTKKHLEDSRQNKDKKKDKRKFIEGIDNECILTSLEYPTNLQELKFTFLKYCLTTNVSCNNKHETLETKTSEEKESEHKSQNSIFQADSFQQMTEQHESSSVQSAKINLKTYFTQMTDSESQRTSKTNSKESISQMEILVMRLANFQMKSFNAFVNHFFKKIEQASTIVNVIGLDAITDSMCQMALGKQARNNGIKTQVGMGNMQLKLFSNSVSQENSNILLSTWADLILFAEDPKTLYQITESLNTDQKEEKANRKKKTWTPSIGGTSACITDQKNKEKEAVLFRQKMLSLLNFLILNTTKNLFLESVTKANFLSLVITEILANRQDRRSLSEFQLRQLKEIQPTTQSPTKQILTQTEAIAVFDLTFQKEVWLKEALDMIFVKWQKVIDIIFQQQVKNPHIHWQLVFEKCVSYVNKQLSLLTVLVFGLVQILENLQMHIKFLIENGAISEEIKRQVEKSEYKKVCIETMIKELIGCSKVFGLDDTEINGFNNHKYSRNAQSSDFITVEQGFKFIHRQENAKQLRMWELITKQNILILQNYILNIELITKMFENKPLHTASWVVNFHKQAKTLMKKVKSQNLQMFFDKFYEKIPNLWQNLNFDERDDKKISYQMQQNIRSYPRQRISSIKQKHQMSGIEKQALIVNYMIKAELELYESYTKSHVMNCREEGSTMTTIVSGNSLLKSQKPAIFDDINIEALLIFNYKNSINSQKGMMNNLFVKRSPKTNLTLKPLSSFAPNANFFTLSPRKPPSKQSNIQPFQKRADSGFGKTKPKQLENLQSNEYEIDVALLQTIQYTREEISFLKELNSYLKFINEINFEYEFYYWKNASYEKKFNLKQKDGLMNDSETPIPSSRENSNLDSDPQTKKNSPYLKKMITYNDYAREKTQNLLTTAQLFKQLAQINKNIPTTRSQFIGCPRIYNQELQMRLGNHQNIENEEKENVKNLYKQKIQQFHGCLKIHNQSLMLIVKAALQAKNYWKAVSTNVFPDDEILNEEKQEYVLKNQNKLQKVSEYDIQSSFQERFFQKKILEKLEEYINYYREITEQMNYCLDSGLLKDQVPEFQKESVDGGDTIRNKRTNSQSSKANGRQTLSPRQPSGQLIRRDSPKKPSIMIPAQQAKPSKVRVYSLLEALISKKQQPKMNRFQIAASIYQYSQKILRLNCYISSFYVQRKIYLDIISNQQLSQQKYMKVKIIGKEYFEKIKQYSVEIYEDKEITENNLRNVQLIYEKKLLIVMVSLLELIYYGNEHSKTVLGKWKHDTNDFRTRKGKFCTVRDINEKEFERGYKNHGFKIRKNTIKKYSQIFKKYLKYRFKSNTGQIFLKEGLNNLYQSAQNDDATKSDYFHIAKLLSEVFEFGETIEQFDQEKFIQMLRKLRNQQTDEQFLKFYIQIMEKQTQYVSDFQSQEQKVNCLKKKFNYLILREIYFFLYYDIDCLQQKSAYSKKNYELYQNRIFDFYQEIIDKSYEDFMVKKEMELKKRSVYLQNYLLKYQDQPQLVKVEKNLNKLLVCVFNQVMLIYTQDIKMEIKKKCEQVEALNHQIKKNPQQPLHTHYLSSEFYQDKSLFQKKPQQPPEQETKPVSKDWKSGSNKTFNNSQKYSEASVPSASIKMLYNLFPKLISQHRDSRITVLKSHKSSMQSDKSSQILKSSSVIQSQQQTIKKATFKVFTIESMNLHEAINIYHEMRHKNSEAVENYLTNLKQYVANTKSLKRDDLTEMEIRTLQTNEQSIVSLLKRQIIQKINQLKFQLVQKNLISRIQKLYINLDVRHKVFESFKDKILSYQMQKAKIYHQYMDYIRGLKLDVYSHIANQQSLPYIKILNAIKFYRLQIKKEELQNKVRQEFGKNLKKWNDGIQEDIMNYNQWLQSEEKQWNKAKLSVQAEKNQFLLVYDSIKKELKRQAKKRELDEQREMKKHQQLIKTQFMASLNDLKKVEKPAKELKKIASNKKNLFMAQKQKLDKLFEFTPSNPAFVKIQYKEEKQRHSTIETPSQSLQQQNVFGTYSIHKNGNKSGFKTPQLNKSTSVHILNHRSLSKHSTTTNQQPIRPTTSVYSEIRTSCHTMKPKSRDINRASTAVTREKSMDIEGSKFRGIKMKFISKSFEKFMSCAQSRIGEEKNFKKSSEYCETYSINNENAKNKSGVYVCETQIKSGGLLKQTRNVSSGIAYNKGIIKNF